MTNQAQLEVIMNLIINSGEAKSLAIEAIGFAKEEQFNIAEDKLIEAKSALTSAHKSQTSLLTKEAQGEKTELSLLMVHGQDHLMTSIAFVDMASEIIDVYKKLEKVGQK